MKNLIIVISMFLFTTVMYSQQVYNYEEGDVIDDFSVLDTNGNEINLYEITAQGKYVFFDFFFDTCPPCQLSTPIFNEFYDTYGCNEGALFMISMNDGSDTDIEVQAFEDEFGGNFHHAPAVSADGGAAAVDINFGVIGYPTFCIIGPDNTLLNKGFFTNFNDISDFVNAIPAGANAQPMACSLGFNEADVLNFSLYPNPTDGGSFNILLATSVNDATVTIYNILGAVIYSRNHSSNQIEISAEMSSGNYIVSVETPQGILNKSLVVE